MASRGIPTSTRRILEGIAFGLVFGSIFPIVATVIASLAEDVELTVSTAVTMHRENPLLQMIDTIPLLLAMAFAIVGRVLSRLDGFIEGLEGTVYQRNVVIKRSQDEADASRRAKSALLSQVVAEVHRLLEKSNHHLRQLHRTTLDEKQHATLKGISWTHSRIIDAIWQAEVLSEIDGPPRTVELAPFSPMELCQSLARQFSGMMPAGVDVKVERDENVPALITAARARIEQALFALFRCATHVLPEDDLVVTVSQFGAIHGGIPKLHISATNLSIDSSQFNSETVFRTFAELDPDVYEEDGRAQLELALLRHLAESQGGEVGVRAVGDGGLSFWMLFPYRPADAEGLDADSPTPVLAPAAQNDAA